MCLRVHPVTSTSPARRPCLAALVASRRGDGLCCSRSGGRPGAAASKHRSCHRSSDKTEQIRGAYNEKQAERKKRLIRSSRGENTAAEPAVCTMGLLQSVYLYVMAADSPPSSPSVFPPLAVPPSSRLAVTLNSHPVPPEDTRSLWSSTHRSPHFLLSPCKQEVTRSPAELSSDGVRAEAGVRSGLHVWEVLWSPEHRGSHAVLGVSRKDCPLQTSGYNVLVGGDSQSWGWELKTNQLWHGGRMLGRYPGNRRRDSRPGSSLKEAGTPLLIPERILLVLDADAGTLGFVVDGSFLGVAFQELPREAELFPAVSSVRGGARIRLRYLNGTTRDPPALMDLCGLSIRHFLGQQRQNQTDKLPLPPILQHYLLISQ